MAPPLGTLRVEIIEASGLYVKDSDGKDNAYCKIKTGDSKERTRVIKDSNSPVWDEEFSFAVKKLDEVVKIEILHHKKGSKDAFLGQYKFTVREVAERGEVDSWFTLQKRSKSSKVKGKVHVRLSWDGYQIPTDLFVFVKEARSLSGTTKKSNLVASLRFGDYESQTQAANGPAPKWDETIQFPWDEKAKDMTLEVRDETTDEKIASVKVPTKSIDDASRKGQWYELKSAGKKGSSAPEIFLKLSFDEEGKPKEEKKKMKRRSSSAQLEPAMDIIGAAEELEELPDMSEAGSGSDEDMSDIEDSLSASGHFKKKRGFLDRFKAAAEQGKIFIRDLEASVAGVPANGGPQAKKGPQVVIEFVFEKQNLITEPKSGATPKWKDSDFMFTLKEFSSELKIKLWEIPPGADAVEATENKSNLIGTGELTLQKLETAPKFKDSLTIALSKVKKQNYSGSEVNCTVQFQPTVVLDDEDFEEEQLPPDLQDSNPLGKLVVEVKAARDLVILDGKSTCDAFFTVDCQGQNYSSSPIPDNTSPEFEETWECDINTLENSRFLICVWDHDSKSGKDELLGALKIPISDLADGKEVDRWFPLGRKAKMTTVSGDVHLRIHYSGKGIKRGGTRSRRNSEATSASDESSGLGRRKKKPLDEDEDTGGGGSEDEKHGESTDDLDLDDDDDDDDEDDEDEGDDLPEDVLGQAIIQIIEARDLKKTGSKVDSYVTVRLSDEKHKTKIVKGTVVPRWDDEVTFNVSDMLSDIEVSVWSVDRSGDNTFIGKVSIGVETLAESSKARDDWYPLKGESDGKKGKEKDKLTPAVHLRLQFKKRVYKERKPKTLFGKKSEIRNDDVKPDLLFKVILLGESGVGKTNLFTRIIHNSFEDGSKATLGVEFATKTFKAERNIVRVQLSDTAGQERFRSVSRQYYRGAMAGIIVYDVTSMSSFNRVQSWIEEIREHANNPLLHLLLLGNKVDLDDIREVPTEKAMELAQKYDMLFMECSAKRATNVARAFREILTAIYEQARTTGIQKISDNPYAVVDPSEDLDVIKLDGSKTIVISAEDAHYGEGVKPAGASSCKC